MNAENFLSDTNANEDLIGTVKRQKRVVKKLTKLHNRLIK